MSFAAVEQGTLLQPDGGPVETYSFADDGVRRTVRLASGRTVESLVKTVGGTGGRSAHSAFWSAWLRGAAPSPAGVERTVTVADLFAGCGGLSVGVREACASVGRAERTVLAADVNETALAVFKDNFDPDRVSTDPIEQIVDGQLGAPLTVLESELAGSLAGLDLAVGGPPCQGHSDLNNHTRRNDPKNSLYLRMGRFVEVVRPRHVLIENVPGVVHDKTQVVHRVREHLVALGYRVDDGVVAADALGWPQRRRRHLLLASLEAHPSIEALRNDFAQPANNLWWAIADLRSAYDTEGGPFDSSARHSAENKRRIDYLFDSGLYELPDVLRPDCHRLKPHTYRSVYGRLRPDEPAPTITSGFGSTGQGRFVHPYERRTMTPHEAARVQGFPDSFSFAAADGRRSLQEMIGNAVPSRLAYAAVLHLLRQGS